MLLWQASDRMTQVGRLSLAARSKHVVALSQAVQGASASSALIGSWARLFLSLQRVAAEAEHSIAFAQFCGTAGRKFRDRTHELTATGAQWAIIPKWVGLVFRLLGESDISNRISGTAGMACAARTRLSNLREECDALLEKAAGQKAAEQDWARFLFQLVDMKMLPSAWASHHRDTASWVGARCASIQREAASLAEAELRHRFLKEVWARMVVLQLHAKGAQERQASILQHTAVMSSAKMEAEALRAELKECKRQLEAERQFSREERWGRMALGILRDQQSAASGTALKNVTSRAASQRRMSELHFQQVEVQRQEEMDMVTAKAAAEVATVGVQEAAIRRWQLLVLFTSQLQFRLCNQYVLNAVATQQRAVQQIALENSTMRPHLAGLQAEVALAWWARFATYLYLQASARGTRQTLSALITVAHTTRASQALAPCVEHWRRMCQLLMGKAMDGFAGVLRLLSDSQKLHRAKHEAANARQFAKMQEAMQKHAAHAVSAHEMLLQESKRTLSHVRRFKNPILAPDGLEAQCEHALQKCRYMLEQSLVAIPPGEKP